MRKALARKRARGERGAVALEAALTFPILLLLILGIIELTFLMRDHAVVVSDTRLGARIASTGSNAGAGTCPTGTGAPPCVPANVPALAQLAADAIQRAGSRDAGRPDRVPAGLQGEHRAATPAPTATTTMPTSCAGFSNCVMFKWRPSENKFRYNSGSWISATINACFPDATCDRVGIALSAKHKTFTGLFGSQLTLKDHAVMNFEPLPAQICAAGAHA